MNEKALLLQISHIATESATFGAAVEHIGALLERELGGKGLIANQIEEYSGGIFSTDGIAPYAEQFFSETANQASRSLYTVALRANGQELGRLIVFFDFVDAEEGLHQRVANFAAEQLGMMLERLRLAKRRRQLRSEIAKIRFNLATRKALHRAEGILAKRGMRADAARLWLRSEASKQGLSTMHVANELFEREMAYVPEPSSVEISLAAFG